MSLTIAVAGGRDFKDYKLLKRTLDEIYNKMKIKCIITGGVRGADKLAAKYSLEKGIPLIEKIPDWKKYGKNAGLIRNGDIIRDVDRVVCFWDGKSKGTKNVIDRCQRKDLTIINYRK